ncbi:MAG: integral rane sensor hybrid histidine kinase, partial [Brevundimonas sp.]|nr:integral rane sensor hybrid histidine kinase [Brevundimonas sp.]
MTPDQKRHIALAMMNRSRQWKTRVGIGAVITLAFYSFVGPVFAACWFAAYGLVQVLEQRLAPDGKLARRLGDRYFATCLVLVFVANVLFGSMAAAQVLSGTMAGLTCAGLLVGGAIMNAVLISPGSRPLVLASVAPQIVYALALPVGALAIDGSPLFAFQITVATGLMVMACIAAWIRLSETFAAMEAAQAQAEDANRAKSDFLATMS